MYKKGSLKKFWSSQDIEELKFVKHEEPFSGFNLESSGDKDRYRSINVNLYRGLPSCIDENNLTENFSWIKNKFYAVSLMYSGDILPLHRDRYSVYREHNQITNIHDIVRCIVFLEDRKPGHFLEIDGTNISHWKAGDWVSWKGDALHLACNLGIEPRYTLQITGQLI